MANAAFIGKSDRDGKLGTRRYLIRANDECHPWHHVGARRLSRVDICEVEQEGRYETRLLVQQVVQAHADWYQNGGIGRVEVDRQKVQPPLPLLLQSLTRNLEAPPFGRGSLLKHVHIDALSNLKQTPKIAASKFDLDGAPDFSTQGREKLSLSLELRHRITHPKPAAELIVSNSELDIHKDAFAWFLEAFNRFKRSLLRSYPA